MTFSPARPLLCFWLRAVTATLALAARAAGLQATDWRYQQSLPVERAGVVRVALPPATLDAAAPGLSDLRVTDGNGREVPYLVSVVSPAARPAALVPKSFRATLTDTGTELLIETGTSTAIASVVLASPAPAFLKSARVEVSDDGEHWRLLRAGVPLFRQYGAEQRSVEVGVAASHVRVSIDDTRSRPVPFTAATLLPARTTAPVPRIPLAGTHITQREEFDHETVLTVDVGARQVPLASMELSAADPIFTRKVVVAVREIRDEAAVERTLATGTIFRLSVDGLPPAMELSVPITASVASRELIVRIENGDSPPLAIESVSFQQRPVWLVFWATTPGTYTLLTGNPRAAAPHYDLSPFSVMLGATAPSPLPIGPIEPNPGYAPRSAPPLAELRGGPIDPAPWTFRKTVQVTGNGVQQLELDPAVLGGSQSNLADLRLVRGANQIPYLLERPALTRALRVTATAASTDGRTHVSRWQVKLPHAGIPLSHLTLASPTPIFRRHIRVYEVLTDERAGSYLHALASGDWNKVPGAEGRLTLNLNDRPRSDGFVIETENGDNPPIELGPVELTYPVVRLLFRTDAAPLELLYGNTEASAPRYDLALIADQLIAADRNTASLGPEQRRVPSRWAGLASARAGILFWSALALVVVVLLFVVAKALPKPPAPGAP